LHWVRTTQLSGNWALKLGIKSDGAITIYIMPRTSPNSLNVNSTGIFPVTVAILGT
jgi:hypothetical protein